MHQLYPKADLLTRDVIGAAIEVHREKGPGLVESIYERCFLREMQLREIPVEHQLAVPIEYKGYQFEELLRLDMLVDKCLIVELKAVERILPIHIAQLLSYMKLLNIPIGLLFNFHELKLTDGLRRVVLKGADTPD